MNSLNENYNFYSLFGPIEQNRLVICTNSTSLSQPLSNSSNLIQRPIKKLNQLSTKLFIGNLPPNTTLSELHQLFGKYGRVNMNLSIVKEDNYAFIHFFDEKEAEYACRELNNSLYKNRYIRVQFSTSMGHINKIRSLDFKKNKITQSVTIQNLVASGLYPASSISTDTTKKRPLRCPIQSSSFHDLSIEGFQSNLLYIQSIERSFLVQNYIKQQAQLNGFN